MNLVQPLQSSHRLQRPLHGLCVSTGHVHCSGCPFPSCWEKPFHRVLLDRWRRRCSLVPASLPVPTAHHALLPDSIPPRNKQDRPHSRPDSVQTAHQTRPGQTLRRLTVASFHASLLCFRASFKLGFTQLCLSTLVHGSPKAHKMQHKAK